MTHGDDERPARDRFGCVPVFWLRMISGNELKVGCALMGRADANGGAHASISQLVDDTGLEARSVRRALQELESDGIAMRLAIGTGRRSSSYAMKLSVRSDAQATVPSVRVDAQATVSVRTDAQASDSQSAQDVPPGCAPARTLECAPARTHTDNRIITDLAHASAREEVQKTTDEERADQTAGYEHFRQAGKRLGFVDSQPSAELVSAFEMIGFNGDARYRACRSLRRLPARESLLRAWLLQAHADGLRGDEAVAFAEGAVQRGGSPCPAGDAK
jgi:hypothetical protein